MAPAPRSNPPNAGAGKEKPPAAGPPGFNDFLEWMRTQSTGGEPVADQRALIPKERKKFQRQDTEAKADRPPAPATAPAAPAVPTTPVAPTTPAAPAAPAEKTPPAVAAILPAASEASPPGLPAESRPVQAAPGSADSASGRVRRGQQTVTKRNSWLGLVVQLGVLGLLVASFLLGRATVPKAGPPQVAAPAAPEATTPDGKVTTNVLSGPNAALIDQAMSDTQASRFKEATAALEQVRASGQRIHGLSLQLALLAVFSNEYPRAVPLLNEAIAEGDDIGEAYNLRATMASRRNAFGGVGINDYETASKLDPFDARTFFYWGSSLRRAGNSQQALTRIQQALDRLREPTAEGYYRLCLRLTQIELGRDKEFADELARQLALPHPSMDWLFTAAALDLRDGKYDGATAYIERAQACGDPDGFSMRMRDFYFSQFSTRKELARFFGKLVPSKPGQTVPDASPAPDGSAAPLTGLNVPAMPPPALPGATVAR